MRREKQNPEVESEDKKMGVNNSQENTWIQDLEALSWLKKCGGICDGAGLVGGFDWGKVACRGAESCQVRGEVWGSP